MSNKEKVLGDHLVPRKALTVQDLTENGWFMRSCNKSDEICLLDMGFEINGGNWDFPYANHKLCYNTDGVVTRANDLEPNEFYIRNEIFRVNDNFYWRRTDDILPETTKSKPNKLGKLNLNKKDKTIPRSLKKEVPAQMSFNFSKGKTSNLRTRIDTFIQTKKSENRLAYKEFVYTRFEECIVRILTNEERFIPHALCSKSERYIESFLTDHDLHGVVEINSRSVHIVNKADKEDV